MPDCPDCGVTQAEASVLGFACTNHGCPMQPDRQRALADPTLSDAVKRAMRRFWARCDEHDNAQA